MRCGATACALLLAAGVAGAEDRDVAVSRGPGLLRVETTLPGPVLDMATHHGALVLLVRPAPADGAETAGVDCDAAAQPSRELWRLVPPGADGGEARAERLRADVAPGTQRIWSIDVLATGDEQVVAAAPGRLVVLPLDGSPQRALLENAELRPRSASLAAGGSPPRPLLVATGLGRARFLRSGGEGGDWPALLDLRLDKNVRPGRNGLWLGSWPPVRIGEAGGALHFATPPAAVSRRRLRGQAVAIAGDDVRRLEWWAALPEEEEILERAFVVIGDEPALLVTTRRADKLGLFAEKRLRLFRLLEDRSRMGHPPFFAVETHANLWQSVVPYVRDADGDGVEDLILAYWKGLKDDRIVLDVYRGLGDGRLSPRARTTAFDVDHGDRSFIDFGHDLDGDGVADLLLRDRDRLLVFAGSAADGEDIVARPAAHEAALSDRPPGDDEAGGVVIGVGGDGVSAYEAGGGPPRPRVVDLDGDGRGEVVDLAPLGDGRVRLTLLRFD